MYRRRKVKLIKVKIYGFGKWVNQDFDIKSDYQIIFGNNEAGKTTFLNFIKSILFGFASGRGTNKFEQYKPRNGGSYGGELIFQDSDNNSWTVKRVEGKGDGDLSLFREDQKVPNSLLTKITSGFSKADFEATHVMNDESIRSIYDLDEQKLETEILALGAAGSKEWLQTADDLESDSAEIYKPRGTKQPLTTSIKRYQELQREKAQFDDQQVQYSKINNKLMELKKELATSETKYNNLLENQKALNNLHEKLPRYREYLALKQISLDTASLISQSDWDDYLENKGQLNALNTSKRRQADATLTDQEEAMLENYRSNQADIDLIANNKNKIQEKIFDTRQFTDSLRKSDFKSDQVRAENPLYDDRMELLTRDDIQQLNVTTPKSNFNLGILVSIIALVITFFVPNPIRIVTGIVFVVTLIWSFYQKKIVNDSLAELDESKHKILSNKNLDKLTVEQAKSIQPVISQIKSLKLEQAELDSKVNQSTGELDKWKNLMVKVHIVDSVENVEDVIPEVESYFNKLTRLKEKIDLMERSKIETSEFLKNHTSSISKINQNLANLFSKYSVENENEFVDLHEHQKQQADNINKLNNDVEYLGNDISNFEKITNLDSIELDLQSINNQVNTIQSERNVKLNEQGSLENQLKQVFDDSAYTKLVEDITQCESEMIDEYDEWLSGNLASKWIHEMLNLASENRYPRMIEKAKSYFSILTNGNYVDINMNKQNHLSLTRKDKTIFDVHELSKGTTVQLYVSLRLAFVTEISDIVDLPILIDDAFVDFDSSRSQNVFKLIKEISSDNQVIFVTANLTEELPEDHVLRI
ncbi:hypothetical protein FHL04_02810 [Lactobacillus salsicarnum]|nr:hypothetical protein [Companilactobacillus mishanensis]